MLVIQENMTPDPLDTIRVPDQPLQCSGPADNSLLSLKKLPQQERSRSLVGYLLDATVRLLGEGTPVSTRTIAEKAGVGIGSLYEYFPSKEAIFAHLIERDLQRNEARLRAHVAALADQDARAKITAIVDFGVEQFLSGSAFKRRLFENIYQLKKVRETLRAWDGIAALFRQLMREHREELRIAESEFELAAYVLSNGVQGLLQVHVFSDNARFSKEQLKAAITELSVRYLLW